MLILCLGSLGDVGRVTQNDCSDDHPGDEEIEHLRLQVMPEGGLLAPDLRDHVGGAMVVGVDEGEDHQQHQGGDEQAITHGVLSGRLVLRRIPRRRGGLLLRLRLVLLGSSSSPVWLLCRWSYFSLKLKTSQVLFVALG